MWLLGGSDARTQVTADAGPEVVVAWSPDGARLALGTGALHLVTLADGRDARVDDVTAPAFAPDGALFARGARGDDAVFALSDGAAAPRLRPARPPAAPAEGEAALDPMPVTFERDGSVLRADLRRGRALRDRPLRARRPRGAGALGRGRGGGGLVRAQVVACNAERVRLEDAGVSARHGGDRGAPRRPRGFLTRIARPGAAPVEVVAVPEARQIRHPRGATVALGGGLDFCPPAVWLGPHND